MTPEAIGWVELSDHAESRLAELPAAVDGDLVIGRLRAGHGEFYRDTDREGHFYNLYLPDHGIAIAFAMHLGSGFEKQAVVQSVFPAGRHRFAGDRFDPWP